LLLISPLCPMSRPDSPKTSNRLEEMLWADVIWLQSLLLCALACSLYCWNVLPLIWPISESFDSLRFYHARVMFVNCVHTDLILHPAVSICFGTVEKNTANIVLMYLLCPLLLCECVASWLILILLPVSIISFGTVEKNTFDIVLMYLLCYCVCAHGIVTDSHFASCR
jgi:hypothetical protein